MFTISNSYEKARFADIECHVEQKQKVLKFLEDDLPYGVPEGKSTPVEKSHLEVLELFAMFGSPGFH